MDYSLLCAEIYKRAEMDYGSRAHWVDTLPFVLLDHNHTPLAGLGSVKISPFEVSFQSFSCLHRLKYNDDSIFEKQRVIFSTH